MPSPQLENIGLALQGFGAGIQGQLPAFNQMLQNREVLAQNKKKAEQEMVVERQKTLFKAAQTGLSLLDSGNYDGLIQFGMQRTQALSEMGANPEDTQRLTQLAIAARNGSEEAEKLLRDELTTTVQIGQGMGILESPKKSTKVVGKFLVDDQSGKVVFDASEEGPRERAQDENGVLRYLDTGEKVFPEVAKIEKELTEQDRFERAKTIRSEIAAANKDFTQIANAWDRVAAGAEDPSAGGDVALIFGFMKMLDPGSTVREGEAAMVQDTAGIPARIRNVYNKAVEGVRLSEEQRQDFFNQAENIFTASKERADAIQNEYIRIGEKYGLTPEDVLVDRGASPEIKMRGADDLPTVASQADFDALPSGALFLEADDSGALVRYRKP